MIINIRVSFRFVAPLLTLLLTTVTAIAFASDGGYTISDGSPITVEDRGLEITPPEGWQILRNAPNMTLMLRDPEFDPDRLVRTMQIYSRTGPLYIDDITAESFSESLVKQFSSASAAITGYRIRNYEAVDMPDGNQGLLFYAEYSANQYNYMHMHLLLSSQKSHYLITYTDLADNFQNASGHTTDALAIAWQTMLSIQLDSHAPTRFLRWVNFLIAVMSLIGVLWGYRLVRGMAARRSYERYASDEDIDDSDLVSADETSYSAAWKMAEASKTATLIDDEDVLLDIENDQDVV